MAEVEVFWRDRRLCICAGTCWVASGELLEATTFSELQKDGEKNVPRAGLRGCVRLWRWLCGSSGVSSGVLMLLELRFL